MHIPQGLCQASATCHPRADPPVYGIRSSSRHLKPTRCLTCLATSANCPAPMHPAISTIVEHALAQQHLFIPALFVVLGTVAQFHSPAQHSLLVAAVSWALVWILVIFRAGVWSNSGSRSRKTTSWLAGAFLALSQICDRAACDKEGIWSNKVCMAMANVISTVDIF